MNLGKSFLNTTSFIQSSAPQKKCEIHPDESYMGICTSSKCEIGRKLVCYECIYQLHSEHSQQVIVFDQLEDNQEEGLRQLLGSEEMLNVYQKVQNYRDKYRNDVEIVNPNLEEMKKTYKRRFRQSIERLEKKIDRQIDEVFEMNHNKGLYLLDALFQKYYPIEEIVRDHSRLKNSNRVGQQMNQLEEKVKNIMINQEQNNQQIMGIERVDEGEKIQEYLDTLFNQIDTNIIQQADQIITSVPFIDDNDNHGFKPLLKLVGEDLGYNSPVWTTGMPTEDQTWEKTVFGESSIVMADFQSLNVKQLLLESYDGDNNRRYSLLQKSKYRPLVEEFQCKSVQKLRWLDGEKSVLELLGGEGLKDVKVLTPQWRINSQQCNTKENFRVRLGCHFSYSQGVFGGDSSNNRCSHEIAGLGLTDDCYKKSNDRFRSAGIRQFNNRNTMPNEMGQFYGRVNVYGR